MRTTVMFRLHTSVVPAIYAALARFFVRVMGVFAQGVGGIVLVRVVVVRMGAALNRRAAQEEKETEIPVPSRPALEGFS